MWYNKVLKFIFKESVTNLGFELALNGNALIQKQAVNEVLQCNNITADYGLLLTSDAALQLVKSRSFALKATGRVEFGSGVIDKIIYEFCSSPYITKGNYEQTIHDLIEIFYYYKNETLDLISDDDLIKFMKTAFDGVCQGSLDLLSGRELFELSRNLRFGYPLYTRNDEPLERILDEDE